MRKNKVKDFYKQISALVWKEGSLYVARSLEVEIASQGKTRKEALANLKEALELYFEKELPVPRLSSYKDLSLEKIDISYA